MTGTMDSRIPFAASGRRQARSGLLDGAAERVGRSLLRWAERRRATGPRTIDLDRVQRRAALGRPFC